MVTLERQIRVWDAYHEHGLTPSAIASKLRMAEATVENIVIGVLLPEPRRCSECGALCTRLSPRGVCAACVASVKIKAMRNGRH